MDGEIALSTNGAISYFQGNGIVKITEITEYRYFSPFRVDLPSILNDFSPL